MEDVTQPLPDTLDDLRRLGFRDLRARHQAGSCPTVADLDGTAHGVILHPAYVEILRLWRGKNFEYRGKGVTTGINRWGAGPATFTRYTFEARVATSRFSDREVVHIDHDLPVNPAWVRAFHDELVEMRPGLYLCCSHLNRGGRLRYLSYFAFDFGD